MLKTSRDAVQEYVLIGLAFGLALACFYPDVFTMSAGLLAGDYRLWHYPLARLLAGDGSLWTDRIGCGFPIFAEGQIALLYPLNFVFYKILPLSFGAAYNYYALFQYWLGGLLFYLYVRSLKVSRAGAFVAGLLFLFGACQGGYFCNANSQKVLVWFPLILFLIDRGLSGRRPLIFPWIGALVGVQINAGHPQSLVYSGLFSAAYYLLRALENPGQESWRLRLGRALGHAAQVAGAALLIGLPQLLATRELAAFSNRLSLPESFAYIGSLPPQGFLGAVFPFLSAYLGPASLYGTIFGLLLAVVAWRERAHWDRRLGILLGFGGAALLIALGQYDPLYRLLIQLTHFHALRVPSRAVFFLMFALAALAGYGWDRLFAEVPGQAVRKTVLGFLWFTAAVFAGVLLLEPALKVLAPWLEQLGQDVIRKQFTGNPLHPYGAAVYQEKLRVFLAGLLAAASPRSHPQVGWWAALYGLNFIWAWRYTVAPGTARQKMAGLAGALLILDLLAYNTSGLFRAQLDSFRRQEAQDAPWAEALRRGGDEGRLYVYCTDLSQRERLPLFFNSGTARGLAEVGLYSPLAPERHRAYFEGLGANDNSLYLAVADPARFAALRPLLDLAGAKFLIGLDAPPGAGWRERFRRGEAALYENEQVLPRAFWLSVAGAVTVSDFNAYARGGAFDPRRQVVFESPAPNAPLAGASGRLAPVRWRQTRPDRLTIVSDQNEPGWLVLADLDYPGWRARVNNTPAALRRADGLFKALALPAGVQTVTLDYRPAYAAVLWLPWAGLGLLSLITLLVLVRAERGRNP